jgi:hypothetical protein
LPQGCRFVSPKQTLLVRRLTISRKPHFPSRMSSSQIILRRLWRIWDRPSCNDDPELLQRNSSPIWRGFHPEHLQHLKDAKPRRYLASIISRPRLQSSFLDVTRIFIISSAVSRLAYTLVVLMACGPGNLYFLSDSKSVYFLIGKPAGKSLISLSEF